MHILRNIASVSLMLLLSASVSFAQDGSGSASELRKVRESFVAATLDSCSPSEEVTENFMTYSERGRAAIDVLLMQLYLAVQLPQDEVERVIDLFDFDRRQWRDIDYTDMSRGGWDMTLHVTRIYALAKTYEWPQSPFYKSPRLSSLLHKAAQWWFDNRPVNPNWWHNDIGVPKKLAAAMILLRDELSEGEMRGILKVLERSAFGRTGQNKAWLAGNQMMKALLTDDVPLAAEARKQMAEEIYVTDDEGIQKDWSFHQHGPQMQFGNYGLAFADGISFWARVFDGTEYAFSDKQIEIVENYILNGLCWPIWKGVMDPSACGRQLHIDGGRGKAYSCAVALSNMAAMQRPRSSVFRKIALQNLQPGLYENELVGSRYYQRSDFGVYRAKDWYASIRMQSERTIGYEFTNGENQRAQFSADGALLLMQSGREYENIFPYWDWRMLPGVTAYFDGSPLRTDDSREDKQNNSAHVGGLSRGRTMVTTMELDRHGLHAFKSNFFFDDIVVSLGSDIRSSRPEISRITTALDQNRLAEEPESGEFRSRAHGRVGWAWHDDRGYVSLDGAEMKVDTPLQKGSWADMAPMYTRVDSGRVFKCWFEHPSDSRGAYAYALLPCRNAASTRAFAKSYASGKPSSGARGKAAENSLPTILRNDDCCQAMTYKGNLFVVVHKAGAYSFGDWRHNFSKPGIYMRIGDDVYSRTLPPANVPDDCRLDFSAVVAMPHPRLLLGAGEERSLAENIASVPQLQKIHDSLLERCGMLIEKPLPERVMEGKRMLGVSRDALERMLYLSYAYRMTGETKYADAAKAVALKVCTFSDWNPSHFLDTAEMALGLAFAYDWLYDVFSAEERRTVSDAVHEKALLASDLPKVTFRSVSNNWNSVCNAGIVSAAAAFFEDWPEEASEWIERSVSSNRIALATYAPDGCYPEGYGYWEYGSEFQLIMNEVLASVLGTDAGLGSSPGFYDSARFMAYMQAPSGECYNFSDGGSATPMMLPLFCFAQKCGEPSLACLEYEKLLACDGHVNDRLLPVNLLLAARHPETILSVPESPALPKSCFFDGENPVFIYRGGWHSPKDSYLALKGGSASSNHAHMDAGSFVYEYTGQRWSMDFGSQRYYSLEKCGLDIWNMSQDSDRWKVFRYENQAHSTLTLDDAHHRVMGFAPVSATFDKKNMHGAEVDLSDVFGKSLVKSAVRRIWLDGKEFLHVEDRIVNANADRSDGSDGHALPLEVKWLMNTPASAEIVSEKAVRLTQGGVSMLLEISSDTPFRPVILSNDPPNYYDAPNSGCRVGFVSTIAPSASATFRVKLSAL